MILWLFLFSFLAYQVGATPKTEAGFAFVNVRSRETPPEGNRYCVNFQQYKAHRLPTSVEEAEPYRVGWWAKKFNKTDVCEPNSRVFVGDQIVPAKYRTSTETFCQSDVVVKDARNRSFVGVQVAIVEHYNASAILFLVERGKNNSFGVREFLWSHFYNPSIEHAKAKIFYVYQENFYANILPKLTHEEKAELRFYRPESPVVDASLGVIWMLAMTAVAIGSLWGASRARSSHTVELQSQPSSIVITSNDGSTTTTNTERLKPPTTHDKNDADRMANASGCTHCMYVLVMVVSVVVVLMLAFYFRPGAVVFFNVFLVVIGTMAVHACSYALFSTLFFGRNFRDLELFSLSQLCCRCCRQSRLSRCSICSRKIYLVSAIFFTGSAALCVIWYVMRKHVYAFFLLDFINFCVCIYGIKETPLRSLRLLTYLLIAMFVYDIFMVFGTQLLTASGCSVMLQVVTGVECSASPAEPSGNDTAPGDGRGYYFIPPVDRNNPEKIPILFGVPSLGDPLMECYDPYVEDGFNLRMLGLGDVIIPGYLIAFCFFVDAVIDKQRRLPSYGLVSLTGYGAGLLTTFVALRLMAVRGLPALLFLIPMTLGPVVVFALLRGHFTRLWRGEIAAKTVEATPT